MRELKFRVWTGKEFVYSEECLGFIGSETDNNLRLKDFFGFVTSEFCPKNSVIQQFTGLTTENGEEIFEGDTVSWFELHSTEYIQREAKIVWSPKVAAFVLDLYDRHLFDDSYGDYCHLNHQFEYTIIKK